MSFQSHFQLPLSGQNVLFFSVHHLCAFSAFLKVEWPTCFVLFLMFIFAVNAFPGESLLLTAWSELAILVILQNTRTVSSHTTANTTVWAVCLGQDYNKIFALFGLLLQRHSLDINEAPKLNVPVNDLGIMLVMSAWRNWLLNRHKLLHLQCSVSGLAPQS